MQGEHAGERGHAVQHHGGLHTTQVNTLDSGYLDNNITLLQAAGGEHGAGELQLCQHQLPGGPHLPPPRPHALPPRRAGGGRAARGRALRGRGVARGRVRRDGGRRAAAGEPLRVRAVPPADGLQAVQVHHLHAE